jgi:UDP-glucose 4-epimerase
MTTHVVFGGCGFIGRHVAKALAERGDDVSVVDVVDFPASCLAAKTTIADLSRAGANEFDSLIGAAEVIHHYAWTTMPATANADPLADLQGNLALTIGLLDAMKRRGGGKIVFASSGGTVYGRLRNIPVPEHHPLEPIVAYGVSKVAAEKYLHLYHYLYGIDARIARISNPYGAGQNPAQRQGAVTTFVHRALAGDTIEIWGDGGVVRDFIYIADVVAGLVALTDAVAFADSNLPIFNIGSGRGASLTEIVDLIERELGRPLCVEIKPARAFDVPVNVLDIVKARRELDWMPRMPLQLGIARMIADLTDDTTRRFASR